MRVLAIGAHPDDVELGCGGALLAHRLAGDEVALLVMTSGEEGPQDDRPRIAEQEEAVAMLGAELYWGGFEDGVVPSDYRAVRAVERVIQAVEPEMIYTQSQNDTHQDHRATAAASVAAARRMARLLCYESPSTVGFSPNFYAEIDNLVEAKLNLLRCHMSQVLGCSFVDLEAVEAQARFRGFSARVRHAEAFEVHRYTWNPMQPRQAPARLDASIEELFTSYEMVPSETKVK